jgi:hypothetical protein
MPNRREFLHTGAAVSAIAANGILVRGAEAIGARPRFALGCAIYDDRYTEGRRFAAVVGAKGVATRALDDGDITSFWCEELEGRLRRERLGVAGFTQFGPMFVVERLAAERGMRLALRVEHRSAAEGTLTHIFSTPRETLELAEGFEALRADWPALMATLACRVGGDDSVWRTGELVAPGLDAPRLPPSSAAPTPFIHYYTPQAEQQGYGSALDGPLYSWVVAPRAQRG